MFRGILPIGTVVSLKNAEPKVMIVGYMPQEVGHPENQHEYSGLIYPIGYQSADKILQFDGNQIEGVHYFGMVNEEQMRFEEYLVSHAELSEEGEDK